MGIKVVDFTGNQIGEQEVPEVFKVPAINEHLIWEIIKAEHANQRQGTHKTKVKGDVSGGGKKPWRQKGTGRARQGSIRAPQWRGGGIVFGPVPRDYRENIPRKKKIAGIRQVIARKILGQNIIVLKDWKMTEVSSKKAFEGFSKIVSVSDFAQAYAENRTLRKNTNDQRRKITLVVADDNRENRLSIRNIPWIQVLHVDRVAAMPLHYNHGLIFTSEAFDKIVEKVR